MIHSPKVANTRIVLIVAIFYFALTLVAVILISLRSNASSDLYQPSALPDRNWLAPTSLSLAVIVIVHLASILSVRKWRTLQRNLRDLEALFGRLNPRQIFLIALCSGIAEELFFRGWLLNETGLLVSSMIFGIAHIPPNRAWLFWPFFSLLMGLVLGALCLWTNTLFYAVGVHVGVNFLNILRLSKGDLTYQSGWR